MSGHSCALTCKLRLAGRSARSTCYGSDGLTLVFGEPLHKRRQITTTPAPAPPPISIHLVGRPWAGLSGGLAAPQACDSSLLPCCPSWTTAEEEEFSADGLCADPVCVIFTSSL